MDKIREYGQWLEKYGINILNPKKEDHNYLNILNALYNKENALQLIIKLKAEDCLHLQEVVSELDNFFLTGIGPVFTNKAPGDKNVKK